MFLNFKSDLDGKQVKFRIYSLKILVLVIHFSIGYSFKNTKVINTYIRKIRIMYVNIHLLCQKMGEMSTGYFFKYINKIRAIISF